MLKPINFLEKFLFSTLLLALLSCSETKIPLISKKDKVEKSEELAIPNFSKLIVTPPPPKIGGDSTISFSVTDQIPLKDVLIELGRVAKIDVDIDSSISGGIVVNAKNRPLKEVIDRIATMGKLRYTFQNGVLHFERDAPYSKNYFVDFLTGSQLWGDVESNLTAILTNSDSGSGSDGGFSAANSSSSAKYTSNKSAGIISIYASKAQHEEVSKYLADVYKMSSAQVLIEAKVVEVTLSKDFSTGIDWTWIEAGKSITTTGSFTGTSVVSAIVPKVKLFGLGGNISASIKLLEKFGDAKAISSPRINAINNQKASLDFSQKKIYFTVSSTAAQAVTGTTTGSNSVINSSITATKNEIDVGVKLDITPSINLATNEITLDIKPKLSIDSGQVAIDPSVNPSTGESLGNTIPIINTRELNTVAKVQSGNILVIGGLMSQNTATNDSGVPFLMRIPIIRYIVGYTSKTYSTVETVIFIKATIINNSAMPSKGDREFYDKFKPDRNDLIQGVRDTL